MQILCGDMSAAEAISLANQSYAQAKTASDAPFTPAVNSELSTGWAVLSNILSAPIAKPVVQVSASTPSVAPFAIGAGIILLAALALK